MGRLSLLFHAWTGDVADCSERFVISSLCGTEVRMQSHEPNRDINVYPYFFVFPNKTHNVKPADSTCQDCLFQPADKKCLTRSLIVLEAVVIYPGVAADNEVKA